MPMYERGDSTGAAVTLEWADGVSWMAHPDEASERGSHAIRTEKGVWLLDPLGAPNVAELLDSLGEVAGVAVLSAYHARDAGTLARRYDVPVSIPTWMDRVAERIDAPVERYTLAPGGPEAGFETLPCRPFPGWQEVFLYHEPTRTLVTPDSLGTSGVHLVDEERLGLSALRRLQPPRQLAGLTPDRILPGHGAPLTEDAGEALAAALDNPRRTFPTVLAENGAEGVCALVGALR